MAIDISQTIARRLADRVADRTSGAGARPGRTGAPLGNDAPARGEGAPESIALVAKPRRLIRPLNDPLDLDAALARLASLLDLEEPQLDAPRGYYLNILV